MIASLVAGLLAVGSNFSTTPAEAALRTLYPPRAAKAVRMNVAGRFAVVLTRGGMMEGEPMVVPLLVERFPDGWQALESLDFACRMERHGIPANDAATLLAGMPKPKDDRVCGVTFGDSGPSAAVDTVRGLMREPLIPHVVVVGDYAQGGWYGAGGGETLYHKVAGRWHVIAGDGGAMSSQEAEAAGVPAGVACALHVAGTKCGSTARGASSTKDRHTLCTGKAIRSFASSRRSDSTDVVARCWVNRIALSGTCVARGAWARVHAFIVS